MRRLEGCRIRTWCSRRLRWIGLLGLRCSGLRRLRADRCGLRRNRLGLAGSQNLRCRLGNFALQFVEFLLNDFFVIREVGFQPLESAGVIFSLEVTLEFIELFVGHLIGQPDTDPHFQGFVNMAQKAVFLGLGHAAEPDFLQ